MTTTDSTPASMGGPLSEAAFVEAVGRYSLDQIRAYLAGPPALIGPDHGRDLDRMAWLLDLHDSVRDKLHRVADESRQLQERLDAATARVGVLEGQLATAKARHVRERRYTDGDSEGSWGSAEECAADCEIPLDAVRHFDICRHCGDMETHDDEGRSYHWSQWPCADAADLGLDGGDPDAA